VLFYFSKVRYIPRPFPQLQTPQNRHFSLYSVANTSTSVPHGIFTGVSLPQFLQRIAVVYSFFSSTANTPFHQPILPPPRIGSGKFVIFLFIAKILLAHLRWLAIFYGQRSYSSFQFIRGCGVGMKVYLDRRRK